MGCLNRVNYEVCFYCLLLNYIGIGLLVLDYYMKFMNVKHIFTIHTAYCICIC